MMQLTPHFTLAELTVTETGLDNTPDETQIQLLLTLAEFLEKVRVVLSNHPITVNSAFRSAEVNAAVGGVADSAHALCFAADITCEGYGTVYEVALAISLAQSAGKLEFDQLIYEQTWVHVSRDPQLRKERLTLASVDNYVAGLVA